MKPVVIALAAFMFLSPTLTQAAPVVFEASGATPADIQAAVDAFRTFLGPLNPNVAGSFPSGRREINWDGVPDAFSAPNNLPANFFNANSPRGTVFFTPGSGFQVSADSANPRQVGPLAQRGAESVAFQVSAGGRSLRRRTPRCMLCLDDNGCADAGSPSSREL